MDQDEVWLFIVNDAGGIVERVPYIVYSSALTVGSTVTLIARQFKVLAVLPYEDGRKVKCIEV